MSYEQRLQDGRLAIYLFHGVTRPHGCRVRNYTRKHLDADEFADVIRRLKAHGNAVSMEQVRRHYEQGEPLPDRAFAITFDDGFQNNLTVAAPLLSEERVPAMFYVTTGFVESNRMGWIDRIEFAVETRSKGALRLPWGERAFDGDDARRQLLSEIRVKVKGDRNMDADALASDIQQQLGLQVTFESDHPLDRKLTWKEVQQLASDPMFMVSGHSHTHRILEYLDDGELAGELDTSLRLLREKGGIVSDHYSYPEGLSFCYSDRVIAALRARGIRCCPSAEDGLNGPGMDLFRLKRIMVN
jgi:peptidoglycan/xylan/chitin deacetylase (PgdA/CDA1 family)